MAQTPKYIAIDSDVLRDLTLLHLLHKSHDRIDKEKIHSTTLKRDLNYFERLYQCVIHDQIRLLIVDAVYQESKHSPNLVAFIKEFCYFPNINAINYQEKAQQARQLASAYCRPYTYQGKERPVPMKSVFVADINKYVPTNDCYIMAQATIEGCPLLTGNGKDFVFNQRNDNRDDHDRVRGIVQINISMGYFTQNEKGFNSVASPILIHDLGPILKNIPAFHTPEQIDDKVKADTLL